MIHATSLRQAGSAERRQFPRVEVLGHIQGDAVALGVPVTMVGTGFDTFDIETSFPFSVGAIHEFRLTRGNGPIVRVRGRIRHSRPLPAQQGGYRVSTHVEFVDGLTEDGRSAAFRMLYDLGSALSCDAE